MPTRTPEQGYPTPRFAVRVTVLYLAVVLAVWAALHFGADEGALPTLLLFGPRWVVAVPLVVLVPLATYARSWWAGGVTLLAGIIVAGPITGGVLNPSGPATVHLRVVTWNMGGVKAGPAFRRFLDQVDPDVVVLQEANGELDVASFPPGWSLSPGGGLRVASRYPVTRRATLTFEKPGAAGGVAWYTLAATDGEVAIANVHLPTVRPGIEAALGSKFRDLGELRHMIEVRKGASRTVRDWLGAVDPGLIVAGDFNMPVESGIYRADWSSFRNAFSEAGVGWGTTKQTRWFGVRIDHVLYDPSWECRRARVGPAMGSDHRPVVADLTRVGD